MSCFRGQQKPSLGFSSWFPPPKQNSKDEPWQFHSSSARPHVRNPPIEGPIEPKRVPKDLRCQLQKAAELKRQSDPNLILGPSLAGQDGFSTQFCQCPVDRCVPLWGGLSAGSQLLLTILPESWPKPQSLSGQRPQSFQLLGKTMLESMKTNKMKKEKQSPMGN